MPIMSDPPGRSTYHTGGPKMDCHLFVVVDHKSIILKATRSNCIVDFPVPMRRS